MRTDGDGQTDRLVANSGFSQFCGRAEKGLNLIVHDSKIAMFLKPVRRVAFRNVDLLSVLR